MATPDTYVELRDVARRYAPAVAALSQVNLRIRHGESVAVIGRSGSGKSTLLNILGLLDRPDEGEVLIDGQRVDVDSDRNRSGRRASDLGFVFQRAHLIPNLTARENVILALRYAGWPEDTIHRQAEQGLHDVGLGHRVDALARNLSGGEMQRVALARTIARPARLWLADEPTGNLDSTQSQAIIELLRDRAAERGACLVVVTHEPEIAARLDRTITLLDGRIADDTDPDGDCDNRTLTGDSPGINGSRTKRVRSTARTWRFVGQALQAHPRRAAVGVLAVALAVTLTVAALGLGQSAGAQVSNLFDARRANQVTASLVLPSEQPSRWPIRFENLQSFPGVTSVEYWQTRPTVEMSNGDVATTTAQLVQADRVPGVATDSRVRWAPGEDAVLDAGELVLGAVLADRLGVTQLDLQPEITVAGSRLRLVGLLTTSRSPTASGSAFIASSTPLDLTPAPTAELFVETAPGAARGIADRLQNLVDPFQTAEMTVNPVLRPDDNRGQLESSIAVSLRILSVVASLAGLLGIVLVNILTISARTVEFGVRRAFGARREELVSLVLGESAILSVIGAALGLMCGFLAIMAVTIAARWQPVFDLRLLLVGLAGAVIFGIAGGLVPAVVAGRIQPADAVRS